MERIFGSAGIRLKNFFSAAGSDERENLNFKRKSALLSGETGCGKKLLLTTLADDFDFQLVEINLPAVYTKSADNVYSEVLKLFKAAIELKNGVVHLTNLDLFNDDSNKLCLYAGFDLVSSSNGNTLIVATSSSVDKIDTDVVSLFQENIRITSLNAPQRLEAFKFFLKCHKQSVPHLENLSKSCYGYNFSDIAAICSKAIFKSYSENTNLNMQCLVEAKLSVVPTSTESLFSSQVNSSSVKWDDIGGIFETKRYLEEAIIWPYKYPRTFKRLNFRPPVGILLYGPPGTGKTMIAKALASELEANFMVISSADFVKSEIGRSEKAIASTFETAKRTSPTIIFIDELESLFGRHETSGNLVKKMVSQITSELDALAQSDFRVTVLASTNALDLVSTDLLRSGRMDLKLTVPLPSFEERIEILKIKAKKVDHESVDCKVVSELMKGFSGADIELVVRFSCLLSIQRSISSVRSGEKIGPSIAKSDLETEKDFSSMLNQVLEQQQNVQIKITQEDVLASIEKVQLF